MPVFVRFQRIGSYEPKFPFGISVRPDDWDDVTHRPKEAALKIIADKKVAKIEQQILNAVANDIEITKTLLKQYVEGVEPMQKSFYYYFDNYIVKQERKDRLSPSTIKGYDTTRQALKEYRKQINLTDINAHFVEEFDKFLVKRGVAQGKGEVKGSRYNRLKHVSTILKDIKRQGIAIDDPFAKGEFNVPKTSENDVFLDFDELRSMMVLVDELPLGTRWYRVLMMYLFACTTGLRISDALDLKWGELDLDEDKMVLKKIAKKTKREFIAPIFDSAAELLAMSVEDINNVEADKKVFYQYSMTTINNTLKELAELANIDKPISFHSARRTCATLLAAEDVNPVFIRDMLGHKSLKMTDSYIKTSETLIALKAKDIDVFSAERLNLNKN